LIKCAIRIAKNFDTQEIKINKDTKIETKNESKLNNLNKETNKLNKNVAKNSMQKKFFANKKLEQIDIEKKILQLYNKTRDERTQERKTLTNKY